MEDVISFLNKPDFKKKIALVVAHTKREPGAYSPTLGLDEYKFSTNFNQMLCTKLTQDYEPVIYFRDGLSIEGTHLEISKWVPNACIETHFNSNKDIRARGCQTLCANRENSKLLADLIEKGVRNSLGLSISVDQGQGGVTVLGPKDRGYTNVQALNCPNILGEWFFGSNSEDCLNFVKNQEAVCVAIKDALDRYFRESSLQ